MTDLGTLGGPASAAVRVTECAGGELFGDERVVADEQVHPVATCLSGSRLGPRAPSSNI